MKGGSVEFKFTGNTKDIESKASGLSSKLKSVASTGASALMGMGAVAGTALIGITTKAVQAQGELEQQIGGTEAVFGKYAKTVQDKAAKAYETAGLSANDYMANINKIGALMQGSGIDTKRAMDLSSAAIQRAGDVASVMGISTEEAMRAVTGAAKGNFTMMDNLGVAMNATNLQAYALSKGIKTSYKEMSQAEKVELAMQMFMEKSAYATGNYAKENKTFAGSLNTLKASIQNLLAGTGSIEIVMKQVENFGKILTEKLVQLFPKIVEVGISMINGLIGMLPQFLQQILPPLITGIMQLTMGLLQAIPLIVPILLDGIVQLTMAIIDYLPEMITIISDMIPTLMPQIIEAIMKIIPALVKNLPAFIKAGMKLVAGIVKGIILGTAQLVKSITDLARKGIDKLKEKFAGKSPLEIGKMLVQGLWKGISDARQWVLDKIKGFGKSVLKGIKKIFGISSPSKEFEIIGRYNVMGLEEGMRKESLKLQDTFDNMFDLSPNLYGTASTNLSPQVNVINNINFKQDALGQMVKDIKTFSGGAKNDYSYGMGA